MKNLVPILLPLALLAGGCSTPVHEVRVDAINSPAGATTRDYSKLAASSESNALLNAEVASVLASELASKGFHETATPSPGTLRLTFEYGLRTPRNVARRVSEPMYGWDFDHSDVIVTQTPAPGGGFTTTTQRISRPPSMRVVGYNEGNVTVSVIDKFLTVNASTASGPAWSVTAISSGESDDIRRVLPILARAVADKAGSNTGGQVTITYRPEEFK